MSFGIEFPESGLKRREYGHLKTEEFRVVEIAPVYASVCSYPLKGSPRTALKGGSNTHYSSDDTGDHR